MKASWFSLLFCAGAAVAQNPTGRITGHVQDNSRSGVPRAAIRITNVKTAVETATTSNGQGMFLAGNLIPGHYQLTVEKPGFKLYERDPLEVRVADTLELDVVLEIGAISERLTVTADAPLIESASASLGQVIDKKRIDELPIANGNVTYFLQLTPGVNTTGGPNANLMPHNTGASSDAVVMGSRSQSSEFTIDGIPNMVGTLIGFVPNPEMVQEFRVETAPYDASTGHFTGAHIDMVMKTGTNQLHGTAFFGYRNQKMMARNYFGADVTPQRVLRWRTSIGGPVVLPRLYNGRNRTFFTYGFDSNFYGTATFGKALVPTVKERAGDFSEILALGSSYSIYDPLTAQAATGGRVSRSAFPGNVIPSERIDPVARKLLDFFPLPNNLSAGADGSFNFDLPSRSRFDNANHMGRIDQVVSANQRLYASFTRAYSKTTTPGVFNNDATGTVFQPSRIVIAADDVLTPRPDLVLELRYGLTRGPYSLRPYSTGFDLASLGISSAVVGQLDRSSTTIPALNLAPFTSLAGPFPGDVENGASTSHFLAGIISHTRGSHNLRTGVEIRFLQWNSAAGGQVAPSYIFGSEWTRGPLDTSSASAIGQGLASFLLGLPTGGFTDRNTTLSQASRYFATFFQDDWRLSRKLMLTLGLRYDFETPATERYNRANRSFDFAAVNPVDAAARANYVQNAIPEIPADHFRVAGGLQFAGVNGVPRGLSEQQLNHFSPRAGVVYQLWPSTVVRAGYGIFYDSLGADRTFAPQQGFSQRTDIVPSVDNGLTFRATLQNPFPGGILQPGGAAGGLRTFLGQTIEFPNPARQTPYVQRWSINLQREFGGRLVLELGYAGNRGTHLPVSENLNAIPSAYLSRSPFRDQSAITSLAQQVPNPFSGLVEFNGTALAGARIAKSQLLRPYPEFGDFTSSSGQGSSWYYAGYVRAEKRLSAGYTFQAAYTWSKLMEATEKLNMQDGEPTHAVSSLDRTHHVAVSSLYDIPLARRNRWIGGWTVGLVYRYQTGAPVGFSNLGFAGRFEDIANPSPSVDRWFNPDAGFVRSAATAPTSVNLRYFPLRLSGVRTQHWNSWDVSVLKNFRIVEHLKFQLRGDFQDALNRPNLNGPNTNPLSPLFGRVTGAGDQRVAYVSGKLIW